MNISFQFTFGTKIDLILAASVFIIFFISSPQLFPSPSVVCLILYDIILMNNDERGEEYVCGSWDKNHVIQGWGCLSFFGFGVFLAVYSEDLSAPFPRLGISDEIESG